jgi:LacI family transcriptional regulator
MSEKNNKRPTIYDLAKLADVSPGTVSRVLNNKDKVNPNTRAKILELAHEIGLKPRATARNNEIAVITEPHFTDRFRGYSGILTSHVAFALSEKNVGMLLPSDPLKQLPGYFIDGVIAITYEPEIQAMLKDLEKTVPVVYFDNFEATEDQYVICSDHYQSGYIAAKHFVERGHKKLAFISGDTPPARVRFKGYTDAISEAGLPLDNKLQILMKENESIYMTVNRIVKCGADGLYVPGTSMQAIESLHVLTNVMNLNVPDDISLIGGENAGISMFQHPPLTTMNAPLDQMAKAAVDMVSALIKKQTIKERSATFPVNLIERDSVR